MDSKQKRLLLHSLGVQDAVQSPPLHGHEKLYMERSRFSLGCYTWTDSGATTAFNAEGGQVHISATFA